LGPVSQLVFKIVNLKASIIWLNLPCLKGWFKARTIHFKMTSHWAFQLKWFWPPTVWNSHVPDEIPNNENICQTLYSYLNVIHVHASTNNSYKKTNKHTNVKIILFTQHLS